MHGRHLRVVSNFSTGCILHCLKGVVQTTTLREFCTKEIKGPNGSTGFHSDENQGRQNTTKSQSHSPTPVDAVQASSYPWKVSVIGLGFVGSACATSIMSMGVVDELCLIDSKLSVVTSELLDLQFAAMFIPSAPRITGGISYSLTQNSDICIVSAGMRQERGKSRNELILKNGVLHKYLIPSLVSYNPNAIFILLGNPVDEIAHIGWKFSGLPLGKIFGSGTFLDTSRFKKELARKLSLPINQIEGYVIGQHGDESVPVWSSVKIGGVALGEFSKAFEGEDSPERTAIHKKIQRRGLRIVDLKGHTAWGVSEVVCEVCKAIIEDKRVVMPLSTSVQGKYGVEDDIFLSVPCVVGREGILDVLNLELSKKEQEGFLAAASKVCERRIKFRL